MKGTRITYHAEPTTARFHVSGAFVRGIMGPVGSGKSVACCMEILGRAMAQAPDAQGVRRTRFAVIRNTYPELKSTTIKTWQEWVPDSSCPITYTTPITARMRDALPDGTRMDMEVLFLSLDSPEDTKKLLSLELTGAWVNEAREMPKAVLDMLTGRVGRYPPKVAGPLTWSGVIMDTNPPDDDHWWYRLAEEATPEGFEFFRQPPALLRSSDDVYTPNPAAENVANQPLGYEYWTRQVAGKTPRWVNVYVMGQYGSVEDGRPIYPEYNDAFHCPGNRLVPMPGLPLLLGFDFGLTPACIMSQCSPAGQLRVFEELVSEDMGIRQFARDVVKPHLLANYTGFSIISTGDPAGRSRDQTAERTCLQELDEAGIPTTPARTNEFLARREAVAGFLTKTVRGEPGFLLDPRCKTLRKGFLGGYKLRRLMVVGEERFKDEPDKNRFSHIHDALQYTAISIVSPPRYGIDEMPNARAATVRPRTDPRVREMTRLAWT